MLMNSSYSTVFNSISAFQELEGMVSKMQNEKEKDLVIEHRFHRQLIGPKGETIQQIRDRYVLQVFSYGALLYCPFVMNKHSYPCLTW